MKELSIGLLNSLGLAWWVEITTQTPRCTYYFGPFMTKGEAEAATAGYVEDLEQEAAQGITIALKRCKPGNLTIFEELAEMSNPGITPVFSGQT